jgi:hypothetical protein
MAERWQRLRVKTVGTLLGKTFVPFGKEGYIGDEVITTIIQQQNNFLRSNKKCIVQNKNDIDYLIETATGSAEDMDTTTITLREIFYQYKDDDGGQLFDAIKKTNTGGTYIFLFHEHNMEKVGNMLSNLDVILDAFGAWYYCDVHFRYMTARPISVVGRIAMSTLKALWANHLAAFKSNDIPAEIDTQALQYSTKKRAPWVRASYIDISKGCNSASITSPMIVNNSVQGQDINSTESGH